MKGMKNLYVALEKNTVSKHSLKGLTQSSMQLKIKQEYKKQREELNRVKAELDKQRAELQDDPDDNPEGDDEAERGRVSNQLVEHGRAEALSRRLATGEIIHDLMQSEQLEMVDQEGAAPCDHPSENR